MRKATGFTATRRSYQPDAQARGWAAPSLALRASMVILLAWASAAPAQDKAEPPPDKPPPSPEQLTDAGAAALLGGGFPTGTESLTEVALLSAGEYQRLWSFWDPNVVRPIPLSMLKFIRDEQPLPKDIGDQENDAYFTMLIYASRTAPRAFDKAANPEADWVHLFQEPHNYRGDVVHFEGKMKRLRKLDPPPMAAQAGVKNYYEGFLYADLLEKDPVFFIVTDLPQGLEPGDHQDVKVGFSGYFYKIFRYKAGDTDKTKMDRLAPLCMGRTLTPLTAPAAAEDEPTAEPSWVSWLGPTFFGVIGATVALLFALGYWFRRSDRQVRQRLTAVRHADFIGPPPEPAPGGEATPPAARPHNRLAEGPGDLPKSEP